MTPDPEVVEVTVVATPTTDGDGASPFVRIIRTMHEPRVVTAWLVYVYTVYALYGLWVWVSPGPTPPLQGLGAIALLAAAIPGVPAVWTGYVGVERFTLLASILGWLLIGLEDLLHILSQPVLDLTRAPGGLLLAALVILGWSGKRWWSIRHTTWAAGREPDTPLRRAQRAAEVERIVTREVARTSAGKDGGGTGA